MPLIYDPLKMNSTVNLKSDHNPEYDANPNLLGHLWTYFTKILPAPQWCLISRLATCHFTALFHSSGMCVFQGADFPLPEKYLSLKNV